MRVTSSPFVQENFEPLVGKWYSAFEIDSDQIETPPLVALKSLINHQGNKCCACKESKAFHNCLLFK